MRSRTRAGEGGRTWRGGRGRCVLHRRGGRDHRWRRRDPVERLHDGLAGLVVVLDDANAGLARPRVETVLVGRRQRDRVEAALRVSELRFEARQINDGEPITGFAIQRPAIDGEMVLAEVRGDVVLGVDAREVDPSLVARLRIVSGAFDEDAHFRK